MSGSMKALIKKKALAGGIALVDTDIPAPGDGQVLIKVKSAAICGTDLHIYQWNAWAAERYTPPVALGHEFSGEVVALGPGIRTLREGMTVTAETHLACGRCTQCRKGRGHTCRNLKVFSQMGLGCFSEYTVVPESMLRTVPESVSFETASVMEPLGVSVRAVHEAQVSGEDVWVIGCGPIGLFAVAAARVLGADRIFATDISPFRLDLARKTGADHTFDPASGSAAEFVLGNTGGAGVGVIIETSGNPSAIQGCFPALRPGGNVVLVGLPSAPVTLDLVKDVIIRESRMWGVFGRTIDDTWIQVEKLLTSARLDIAAVLTHRFGLQDAEEAFETAASGRAGKVLFKIEDT